MTISDLFIISVVLFSRMSYSWDDRVSFSNWLILLSDMHESLSHVFHSLIAHFFLEIILHTKNTSLSGCATVYPLDYWKVSWLLPGFGSYE